jgi:type II secretory ATPase GspE/PulE/Tfp pilus assembly ATPase PilB-like protein
MDNLRSPAIAAGAAHPRATPANSRHDTRQDGLGCVPVPSVPQGQEVAAMSTILGNKPLARGGLADKLAFYNGLQSVTNAIHATTHLDEIMLDLGREICSLFGADRLTIYVVCDGGKSIVTKIKTGLNSYKDFKLPVTDQSVAGYAAFHKRIVNIRDVYDANELALYSPHPNFLRLVDAKTGYHTRQMLVAPVVEAQTGDLVGVVQLINTRSGEPFPEAMEEGVALLCETLAIALRQRQRPVAPIRGKYDALIANAVISAEELELAAQSARRKSLDIETVLIDEFRVKPGAIGEALAAYFDVPYEPFRADRIKPFDLLRNLSREFLESSGWVPIDDTKEGMVVLTTDPERLRGSRAVNNIYPKGRIVYRVCCNREFATALDQLFGAATNATDRESIGDLLSDMHEDGGEEAVEDMKSAAADNEIVKLVNKVIVDAYQQGASDIHIEPYPGRGKTEIRFRKDGMLRPYISVPHGYRSAIAARIKIMCDLDISERRKPQDGKIQFKRFGSLDIELRVATVPSQGGMEDIVLRILGAGEPIPLDKLGLSRRNLEMCKATVSKPYGLFFVCGPTGSGKTTTLHSVLGYLNRPETKIWTAEDPVEITQRGLRQVQVNPKAGLTFAVAMRAFLRCDPDIIMVGEMRDRETVATGIEASLTGHLVLATLHTNSAPESIVRLLDMGMDPFNFADALLGVLAQRLARRLCTSCRKARVATHAELAALLDEYALELTATDAWKRNPKAARESQLREWNAAFGNGNGEIVLYDPVGCDACNGTGYRGRVGLHELLVGTDAIKKNIQEHARVSAMFATALAEGMRTLKQDGIEKVLMGITDIRQVRSVCIK